MTFRFGEEVTGVDVSAAGTLTTLASGKQIAAEAVMYSAGRMGRTEDLNLDAAGLDTDNRGRIDVDDQFRTMVKHIFSVGDVIGFPALGCHVDGSGQVGRVSRVRGTGQRHDRPAADRHLHHPRGVVRGRHRIDLTRQSIPYEFGVSRYRELARGQIAGDSYGMLKLLVSTENHTAARRPHLRHGGHRVGAYRTGCDGLRRHGGVPR